MTRSAWLEQAKDGDAGALAALLNQALNPQGVTVRAERDSYCLNLWLTGTTLPPQPQLVDYLRRTLERIQIDSIGILHIEAEATAHPSQSWTMEMALLSGRVEVTPHPVETHGSTMGEPAPDPESPVPAVTPSPELPPWPDMTLPPPVARAYRELNLSPEATLADLDRAYFKIKSALIRQGRRADLEPLKWAFDTLKDYLEQQARSPLSPGGAEAHPLASDASPQDGTPALPITAPPVSPSPDRTSHPSDVEQVSPGPVSPDPILALQHQLQHRGLPAQVSRQAHQLHVRWPAVRVTNPKQATAQIYAFLARQDLTALGLGEVTTLVVTSLDSRHQAVWRQSLTLPQWPSVEEDTDLMSFNNRYSNGLVFPLLLFLGMILNAMPITNLLLRGIKIWAHEFGHATIAWLAGRQAIPLPIGWTNINPERSALVYGGVLILLGLLYWSGQREKKRWPMVLAGGLGILQFAMTWLMSPRTFDMLFAFGGIGGELYLSTLLMVSFFFPLPAYWRWDFYRYPVVLAAAFTFWGQFWLWKRIRLGYASIPFGMMWGDAEQGDMNILVDRHQWEPGTIIGTYNTLANLCLLALLGVYAYGLYRQHRHRLWMMRQRWGR